MKKILYLGVILCFGGQMYAQEKIVDPQTLGPHPVYFIDSIRVYSLKDFNPEDISSITLVTGDNAIKILGDVAKDGIAYVETKSFSRRRYWKYFISKSTEYAQIVPNPESDTTVQYIINKRLQKGDFSGNLAAINDKVFKSIQIIDKETLIKEYGVTNKLYGVIIKSDVPKDLLGGKDKF